LCVFKIRQFDVISSVISTATIDLGHSTLDSWIHLGPKLNSVWTYRTGKTYKALPDLNSENWPALRLFFKSVFCPDCLSASVLFEIIFICPATNLFGAKFTKLALNLPIWRELLREFFPTLHCLILPWFVCNLQKLFLAAILGTFFLDQHFASNVYMMDRF
jgi:hypothetical protein